MRLREFLATRTGRMYGAMTAFAAIAAGLIGLAGAKPPAAAIGIVTLVCIAAGILLVGLAIAELDAIALLLVSVLGFEAMLYFPTLHVVGRAGPIPIVLLFTVGLASLAVAVTGGQLPRRASAVRHQHGDALGSPR